MSVYLSDPLVSGFTTGAAMLVFTSQIKHIFGIAVPRYTGVFSLIKASAHAAMFHKGSQNDRFLFKAIHSARECSILKGVECNYSVKLIKLLELLQNLIKMWLIQGFTHKP